MAAGDAFVLTPTSVTNGSTSDALRPSAGVEIVIHNISYGGAMELYQTEGTNPILVDSDPGAGSRLGLFLHCTNSVWYQFKNVSGGTIRFSADGMTTK